MAWKPPIRKEFRVRECEGYFSRFGVIDIVLINPFWSFAVGLIFRGGSPALNGFIPIYFFFFGRQVFVAFHILIITNSVV